MCTSWLQAESPLFDIASNLATYPRPKIPHRLVSDSLACLSHVDTLAIYGITQLARTSFSISEDWSRKCDRARSLAGAKNVAV